MNATIIKNGVVLTPGKRAERKDIRITGKTIDQIASVIQPTREDSVVDASGKLVTPGFVNTHTHTGSTLLRGAGGGLPLQEWLRTVMWPAEATFTETTVRAASDLAMAEMIRSGTTMFMDMYHLDMLHLAERVTEVGMKAVLGRGMIALDGRWTERLEAAEELVKTIQSDKSGLLKAAVSPHALYTCPPDFIRKAGELAEKYDVIRHTHVSETAQEVQHHLSSHGVSPCRHLHELGFLTPKTVLAHAVHVTEEELLLLKENRSAVSHNPRSNLKLGSGVAPVRKMLKSGIPVGLGTDSAASNNRLSVLADMQTAALLHAGTEENSTAVQAEDWMSAAWNSGASMLGFPDSGRLEEGSAADVVLIRSDRLHMTPDIHERAADHLLFAAESADITDVWSNGKALMREGSLLTLDEEKVRAEAEAEWRKIAESNV
ncbi:amidohydrolase [Alkalicoccus luteus]|uniref:Amidohydrolase n=1 Tax=Alkalicoccus luteus TaxID=1237094 RepID=A0A969TY69_9BACI|nr:amidohydrolase [Alkalicoccus luteus]NJP38904.1 amidohydrolase [Alkalicoccus luteus]